MMLLFKSIEVEVEKGRWMEVANLYGTSPVLAAEAAATPRAPTLFLLKTPR
jgi:hypothetical protein